YPMKKKTNLRQLTVATVAGLQFALPALAADGTNLTANASASQSAAIQVLKNEVQELANKVNALESQQATNPPAVATNEELDQKVRILERERENDQADAAALAKAQPKISLGANGFSF